MMKQAVGVCLRVLDAIVWSALLGDIPLLMGPKRGVASQMLASKITKDGAKLALSQVRKQRLDGFSSSCLPNSFRDP